MSEPLDVSDLTDLLRHVTAERDAARADADRLYAGLRWVFEDECGCLGGGGPAMDAMVLHVEEADKRSSAATALRTVRFMRHFGTGDG